MTTINEIEIDDFTEAYIEAALWSSTDDNGNPLDDNYGPEDIHPDTLRSMAEDCNNFRKYVLPGTGKCTVAKLLAAIPAHLRKYNQEHGNDAMDGHDFWLTRNRHGAGFWDRGYDKIGEILSDAAHSFGSVDLYVGDDGKIHA